MKKIGLVLILCLIANLMNAQPYIYQVIDKDNNDPLTGKVIFKDGANGCPPYNIELVGMTTGQIYTRLNQYIGQNGLTVDQMQADKYKISIVNNSGCLTTLNAEIKNCTSFNINIDIRSVCNTTKGSATVHVANNLPLPITYQWYDLTGHLLSQKTILTYTDQKELAQGKYIIKVIDANGCQSMEEFEVGKFEFSLSLKLNQICNIKWDAIISIKDKNNMTFVGRYFNLVWNDGTSILNTNKSVHSRMIDRQLVNNVIVTDLATGCNQAISIPQTYSSNLKVSLNDLQHDVYNTNNGFIFLQVDGAISDLTVTVLKNNSLYKTITKAPKSLFSLTNLGAGDYKLIFKDGGDLQCDGAIYEFSIYGCSSEKNNLKIKVIEQILPVTSSNFKMKFDITNSGETGNSKCTYTFFNINSLRKVTIPQPIIDYNDYLKIDVKNSYCQYFFEAICPCGKAKFLIEGCPCDEDWKLDYKDNSVQICKGIIPPLNNLERNYQDKGIINIDVNLSASHFKSSSLGNSKYNYLLQGVRWIDNNDQVVVKLTQNTLNITREVSTTGTYTLEFTDGIGCVYTHAFTIDNTFDYNLKSGTFCTYEIKCGNSVIETKGNSPQLYYNSDNCTAILYCNNSQVASYNGDILQGEYIGRDPATGKCKFKSYCAFKGIQESDLIVSNGSTRVANWNRLSISKTIPDNSIIFRRPDVIGECCQDYEYATIQEAVENLWLLKIEGMNSGRFESMITDRNLTDWDCYTLLLCDKGFIIVEGTPDGIELCKIGSKCMLRNHCKYSNFVKVIGQPDYTFSTRLFPYLAKLVETSQTNCNQHTPECFPNPLQDTIQNRISTKKADLVIQPNPFTEEINLNINLFKENKEYSLTIIDLFGKDIVHFNKLNSSPFSISTNTWPSGIYIATVRSGSLTKAVRILKMK